MLFNTLVQECLDDSVRGHVDRLVELKMGAVEVKEIERIPELEEYLARSIAEIEVAAANAQEKSDPTWDELNKAFWSLL